MVNAREMLDQILRSFGGGGVVAEVYYEVWGVRFDRRLKHIMSREPFIEI